MKEQKEEKPIEEKMVLTVLEEVLEELEKANESLKGMGQKMDDLAGKVEQLETRVKAFEDKEIKIEPPNLEPMEKKIDELPAVMESCIVAARGALREEMAAGLVKVAVAVEAQPKPITRRISFFPDNDYQGNYKTFIRWLIGGIVGLLLIASAYVLGNEWIQHMPRQPVRDAFDMKMRVDTPIATTPPVPARRPRSARIRARPRRNVQILDTLKDSIISK